MNNDTILAILQSAAVLSAALYYATAALAALAVAVFVLAIRRK